MHQNIKPDLENGWFFCCRPYEVVVGSGQREKEYTYPKGTTPLLSTKVVDVIDTTVVQVGGGEAMEVV